MLIWWPGNRRPVQLWQWLAIRNLHDQPSFGLSCKQRFLSCMAFSVYEVVLVACLSHSWFVYALWETFTKKQLSRNSRFSRGLNKPTTRQINHANDFVKAKTQWKRESSVHRVPLVEENVNNSPSLKWKGINCASPLTVHINQGSYLTA